MLHRVRSLRGTDFTLPAQELRPGACGTNFIAIRQECCRSKKCHPFLQEKVDTVEVVVRNTDIMRRTAHSGSGFHIEEKR
jgi:hypothetical protein